MARTGKYCKAKGNRYELKIIKELIDLGYPGLKSSRSESKSLDNDKVDIADPENVMGFYVQCKATKNYPDVIEPLVIFWNKQVQKEKNMGSAGEFVIMTKKMFYDLIRKNETT
jgi:hypothetical protein